MPVLDILFQLTVAFHDELFIFGLNNEYIFLYMNKNFQNLSIF